MTWIQDLPHPCWFVPYINKGAIVAGLSSLWLVTSILVLKLWARGLSVVYFILLLSSETVYQRVEYLVLNSLAWLPNVAAQKPGLLGSRDKRHTCLIHPKEFWMNQLMLWRASALFSSREKLSFKVCQYFLTSLKAWQTIIMHCWIKETHFFEMLLDFWGYQTSLKNHY